MERDLNHWRLEGYKQRMTTKQVREMLLQEDDSVIFQGLLRKLKITEIFPGVWEVYKEPLKD